MHELTKSWSLGAALMTVGLTACARPNHEPATQDDAREQAAEPRAPEPVVTLTQADTLTDLMELQPTLARAELPAAFHSPPPAPTMADLHAAPKLAARDAALAPFLDQFISEPLFAPRPDHTGACEHRDVLSDGTLRHVNRTNWQEGLPVASFVDSDGDSIVDEYFYYTHDADRRLIRIVEDHPEFSTSCVWRTDTVELGYDAYGALVMVDVRSARDVPVSPQRQTRSYDADGRLVSVFSFSQKGKLVAADFVTRSAERVERIDQFTSAGQWKEAMLVTVRQPFIRVDRFYTLQPNRAHEPAWDPTWAYVKVYEQRQDGPVRRAEMMITPQGPELVTEVRVEGQSEIVLDYGDGQVLSREVINADGSGFSEQLNADGVMERILEIAWDESRETLVYTHKGGWQDIYRFNCEPYTPPTVRKREQCTPVPQPISGPHESDK